MWKDKRYYYVDSYLESTYGYKMYKLSLNGGMSCPNRDGKAGNRGCIFCSKGGSGDFATDPSLSITEQIDEAKTLISSKINRNAHVGTSLTRLDDIQDIDNDSVHNNNVFTLDKPMYIAYFQAYTNTYAPVEYLRKIFYEAINNPCIAILSIATRPDCLGDDVIALLDELNKIKPVWIELGLQTIHDSTAKFIHRGYKLNVFERAVTKLNRINVHIIVHMIIGLPGETADMMYESMRYLAKTPIHGVKLQLLHVLKDTMLVNYLPSLKILTLDEYTDIVIHCLEILPQNIVIHRITGDGPKATLIAPMWSRDKKTVINTINHKMKELDTWQGKDYF